MTFRTSNHKLSFSFCVFLIQGLTYAYWTQIPAKMAAVVFIPGKATTSATAAKELWDCIVKQVCCTLIEGVNNHFFTQCRSTLFQRNGSI